ncbi:TPA: alkaline phosphatase D family protein [Pseudomonas aeruginosa]|nr:alkaline phosphatase D family protein [Pseudomonas aeruginosa]
MSGMDLKRRRVVQGLGAGLLLPALGAPAVIASPRARPKLTDGVQSGDVQGDRALVWSRTDRPARMIVEWDTRSVFSEPRRLVSPVTDERLDYTARIDLRGLPADQSIFYRVRFEDARDGSLSKPWFGHLRSAPSEARNIRFVWSGDTCGQGFGINPDIGGMRIYEAMRRRQPDFFLHSGDTIYADGPIPERIETESGRIWRNRVTEAKSKVAYGPLLDVFVLDMRSYRGGNSANLQARRSAATDFLGREQLQWLKRELRGSRAQWKVIAADMPIGLCVPDGKDAQGRDRWEAIANGNDGAALGRELEIADLLRFVQRAEVRNTVWLTADVHYCAAHHYSPERAAFKDFAPFWEFVAGPLNAGSFGPNALDGTFGPQVMFQKAPLVQNSSPFAGYQFFGEVEIDAQSRALTVTLRDLDGEPVFSQELQPDGA